MSVLSKPLPNVKKFMMPSTADKPEAEQDWIMVDTRPLVIGDTFILNDSETNETQRLAKLIMSRIQSWSFTDANGEVLPINMDSMSNLSPIDFNYLRTVKFTPATDTLSTEEKKS